MTTHEEKIELARACAVFGAPYFASVIYGFIYTPVEGARTMFCTPRMILGYDPEWAMEGTVEELAADIVHEVHHFRREHFVRGALVEDKKLFNLAGDLAINPDLKAGGWKLATTKRPAVFPEHYGLPPGLTTEQYYELLLQQKHKTGQRPKPKNAQPKDGKGPPQPNAGGGEEQDESEEAQEGICQGSCGGIAGNPSSSGLEAKLDAQKNVGRSEAEIKGIEKKLANDIKEFAAKNGRGSVPSSLLDWATTFETESYVRWQDELAQVLRDNTGRIQSGGDDFSLQRPAKRSIMRGMPRPGLVEHLPEVAILRDSSGSMGSKQLTDACREAYYVMEALGIDEVWFADADTAISVPWKRVGAQFFKELTEVYGRGGTDFRQPIESALALNPHPDIIVYTTDGDGSVARMPPPDAAVIWCIVPSHYNKAPARWGHTVIISDDPKKRNAPIQYAGEIEETEEDDD
jgi:predicted metal-dependent peptidase